MKILICMIFMAPLAAMANGPSSPEYGIAGVVVADPPRTDTEKALDQQRSSISSESSEIAAPLYVDSQKRLAESFRTPIPESFGIQTRDEE